jgi:hypothetical protein
MKRGVCLILILALMVPVTASAQSKWPKRKRIADWKFWAAAVSMLASEYVDIAETRRCIHAHTCREGNPLLGQGAGREYGVGTAITGGEILAMYYAKKIGSSDPDPDSRNVWMVFFGVTDLVHGIAAYQNAKISLRKLPLNPVQPGQLEIPGLRIWPSGDNVLRLAHQPSELGLPKATPSLDQDLSVRQYRVWNAETFPALRQSRESPPPLSKTVPQNLTLPK